MIIKFNFLKIIPFFYTYQQNSKKLSYICTVLIYQQRRVTAEHIFVSAFFMPIHERIIKYNGFVPPWYGLMAVTAFAGVGQWDRRNRFFCLSSITNNVSYVQTAKHLFVGE